MEKNKIVKTLIGYVENHGRTGAHGYTVTEFGGRQSLALVMTQTDAETVKEKLEKQGHSKVEILDR